MPTLVRLLSVVVLAVAALVGAMAALVAFVEPRRGEMGFDVPIPAPAQLAAGSATSAAAPDARAP